MDRAESVEGNKQSTFQARTLHPSPDKGPNLKRSLPTSILRCYSTEFHAQIVCGCRFQHWLSFVSLFCVRWSALQQGF